MPNLEQTGLLRDRLRGPRLSRRATRSAGRGRTAGAATRRPGHRARDHARVCSTRCAASLAIDVRVPHRDDFDTLQRASEQRLTDPWVLSVTRQPRRSAPPTRRPREAGDGPRPGCTSPARRHVRQVPARRSRTTRHQPERRRRAGRSSPTCSRCWPTPAWSSASRSPERAGGGGSAGRLPAAGSLRADLAGRQRRAAAPRPAAQPSLQGDGARVNPFFRDLYRESPPSSPASPPASTPPRSPRRTAGARGGVPRGRAAAALLLAHHGARRRHRRAQRGRDAQRAADAGELRPALRPGRPQRAAGAGHHLLLHRQRHDQYYFRRSERMVAGSVPPPRLDLANEDLVRSHVHAIWLAETGPSTEAADHRTLVDAGRRRAPVARHPASSCSTAVTDAADAATRPSRAERGARRASPDLAIDCAEPTWWYDGWVERHGASARPSGFDARLRPLARPVPRRAGRAGRAEPARVAPHRHRARPAARPSGAAREAETQLDLLRERRTASRRSRDFYTYRYLASEGFLPGYSFPRLPLAAYIPPPARGTARATTCSGPGSWPSASSAPARSSTTRARATRSPASSCRRTAAGDVTTDEAKPLRAAAATTTTPRTGRPLRDAASSRSAPRTRPAAAADRLHHAPGADLLRRGGAPPGRLRARVTSYRFHDHGARPGRSATPGRRRRGRWPTLTYGDAATVRITNVGPVRRQARTSDRGFWLDPADGRWLTRREAAEATATPARCRRRRRGRRQAPQEAGHPVRRGPPQHPGRHGSTQPLDEDGGALPAVRAGARHRGRLPAGGLRARPASCCPTTTAAGPDAVHRGRRGRRRRAAAAAVRAGRAAPGRPQRRWRSATSTPTPATTSAAPRPAPVREAAATTACCPTATSSTTAASTGTRAWTCSCASPAPTTAAAGRAVRAPSSSTPADRRGRTPSWSAGFVAWLDAAGQRLPDDGAAPGRPRRRPDPDFVYRLPGATRRRVRRRPVHDYADVSRA